MIADAFRSLRCRAPVRDLYVLVIPKDSNLCFRLYFIGSFLKRMVFPVGWLLPPASPCKEHGFVDQNVLRRYEIPRYLSLLYAWVLSSPPSSRHRHRYTVLFSCYQSEATVLLFSRPWCSLSTECDHTCCEVEKVSRGLACVV
jgi:hypothetical protein